MNTHTDSITPQRRSVAENMSSIKGAVGEIVETEREKLGELVQQGKQSVKHARERFEHGVQEHPIRSLLIAAGVGAAVGFLIGRKL